MQCYTPSVHTIKAKPEQRLTCGRSRISKNHQPKYHRIPSRSATLTILASTNAISNSSTNFFGSSSPDRNCVSGMPFASRQLDEHGDLVGIGDVFLLKPCVEGHAYRYAGEFRLSGFPPGNDASSNSLQTLILQGVDFARFVRQPNRRQ